MATNEVDMSSPVEDLCSVRSTRSSRSSSISSSGLSTGSRLNDCVSLWDIKNVEKELHIFYHNEFFKASELLCRLPNFGILSEEQNIYADKIKGYLKEINLNTASMHIIQFRPDVFKAVLDRIMDKVMMELEIHIRSRVKCFIRELNNLSSLEGNFTRIVAAFASMCCLHARICFCEGDQAIWKNLTGKTVTARPDIRLYKDGIRSEHGHDSKLVSVVKVKTESWKGSEDLMWTDLESSRLDDSPESLSDSYHKNESVRGHLSKNILGQHAGELLLDLHKHYSKATSKNLLMPGIIVNGTMVTFTLLEMVNSHFQKLKNNEELQADDEASVFYSRPYDIIYDEDRDILIEMFIGLNNIDSNSLVLTEDKTDIY